METKKEESIRKAYEKEGFKWSQIKNNVNPDTGILTLTVPSQKSDFEGYSKAVESKMLTSICFNNQGLHMILESLKGISTNNGWIRIEGAKDFPEPGQYWVIDDDGDMFITDMEFFEDMFDWSVIRYYQPIVKPKPPIY